ncbi:hypothetical protein V9657_004525 [Vibrio vulnificus]|uniref:hypothetical protein n=1 Tax=Vibrio TaxID=662 RepID=UPI0001B99BBC|nr:MULTISPECIES: hypothetical protein [Vibrio]EKF9835888.1 hypothetical protein [Vibrio cholerae]EEX67186.1 hypothetical protein VCJ_000534 [Vibrio metoecus]EIT7028591.1 hypothetical protein [Vibrio vulnificus]EKF9846789.1 hypothetical protein [Vibrio cholerae]MBG0757470.1 hypothetical protein [Vibrio cidicii]
MTNSIEKMKREGQAIEIHPGGTADLPRLNEMLKLHPDYIEGIEFTFAEKIGHNQVQFHYDHPDTFTEEQAELARVLVANVKNDFMCIK